MQMVKRALTGLGGWLVLCCVLVAVLGLGLQVGCSSGSNSPEGTQVVQAPSALTYSTGSTNPAVYTKGTAIVANIPSSGGGAVASYAVSPALPAGLSLNSSTGIISGIPTAITATASYTITAMNAGGSTTVTLIITVNDAAPNGLTYATNPAIYTKGTAIAPNTPSSGGGAVLSYAISPALPAGLSLNTGTGVISGTPSALVGISSFTITASNSGGTTIASVAITVNDAAPGSLTYSSNPAVYTKGTAITPNFPSSGGGAVLSYASSPALPAGLGLDIATGVITGTPTAITAIANYIVTAANTSGSTTASVSITVNDAAPSIAYGSGSFSFTTGLAITTLTPTNSGGTVVTWDINPALPTGLSFSTANGSISGTPSVSTPAAPYTVTAINSGGSSTVSPIIEVKPPGPLIRSFTSSTPVVSMGTQVTLSWDLDGSVTTLLLDGAKQPTKSGSVKVTPVRRQIFTLVASDENGRKETAIVKVAAHGLDLLAGNAGGGGSLDGQGVNARLTFPGPAATDAQGNFYFADYGFNVIRKVSLNGNISTFAGVPGNGGYVDGPASTAQFSTISGLAFAPDGSLFVVDHGNGKLRKVSGGQVSTFISLGGGGSGMIQENPAFDLAGNLYVPLNFEGRVVKVTAGGVVTNAATGLIYPTWVCVAHDGDLVVVDGFGGGVFKGAIGGNLAQVSFSYATGDPGGSGSFWGHVSSMAIDGSGHWFLETGTQILQVNAVNQLTTLAQVDGNQYGTGFFRGIAWSSAGFLWVPKTLFGAIVGKVVPGMPYAAVAGSTYVRGYQDGTGDKALFNDPGGIAFGLTGNVLVADAGNSKLRSIAANGEVSTVPVSSGTAPKSYMWMDPTGKLYFTVWNDQGVFRLSNGVVSRVSNPGALDAVTGITGDGTGNLYVSDDPWSSGYARVQKVTTSGVVTPLAGGFSGHSDGQGTSASFNVPRGIAYSGGVLFVADFYNNTIRKITLSGKVTTLAGLPGPPDGFADGTGVAARFYNPETVVADLSGNVYVADTGNHCIRKITPQGVVTTIMGSPTRIGIGLGDAGTLYHPKGLLITSEGDLVVMDTGAVLLITAPDKH